MNTIPTKSAVHPLTLRARQRVAHLWTVDGMSESDIVKTLADEGLRRPDGRHWTAHAVGKLVAAIKWANAEDMSKLPSVQATSDSDRGVYFAKSELGQDGAIATAVTPRWSKKLNGFDGSLRQRNGQHRTSRGQLTTDPCTRSRE